LRPQTRRAANEGDDQKDPNDMPPEEVSSDHSGSPVSQSRDQGDDAWDAPLPQDGATVPQWSDNFPWKCRSPYPTERYIATRFSQTKRGDSIVGQRHELFPGRQDFDIKAASVN
jgi:hypothetical protein